MEALDLSIFRGRRILVTGHTGFKGAWLTLWLTQLGAHVTGIALPPQEDRALFSVLRLEELCDSVMLDIRDGEALRRAVREAHCEVVFHLAAQSLVRRGYDEPVLTFETNVGGTVNILDAARDANDVSAVLVVTTDKCYAHDYGITRPFREHDPLGGRDPYSASKACAEIATAAFRASYAHDAMIVMSARAGNVIGGGDWAPDRLVPDVIRASIARKPVDIRCPDAVRPWQHVLECIQGYLRLGARALRGDRDVAKAWNFGPDAGGEVPVRRVLELLHQSISFEWRYLEPPQHLHEAEVLRLDSSMARNELGWTPRYNVEEAIALTGEWYTRVLAGEDARIITSAQLRAYAA